MRKKRKSFLISDETKSKFDKQIWESEALNLYFSAKLKERNMRMKIKSCLVAVALMLLWCNLSHAQQQTTSPEKQALIKEFLEVTGVRKDTDEIINLVLISIDREIQKTVSLLLEQDPSLTREQKKEMQKDLEASASRMIQRYRELFTQKINLGQLIEDIYYPLYDKHFTENELRDLIAFYKTPTGKKVISVMPALVVDSMSKLNEVLLPIVQKFIKETSEAELVEFLKEKKQKNSKPKRT
jgi:hypothetical protein